MVLPALLALFVVLAEAARAGSLYDVAKISVDATAQDAVAARQMGMAEAGTRAFKIVLQRLVPASVLEQLPEFGKEQVEGMVSGVAIRKEQNSTTRYVATLDVNFNEHAVKQFLVDQAIPYSESRAASISILPLLIEGGSVTSEGSEGWRRAWNNLDIAHSITPATILRARQDLDMETVRAVLAGDSGAFTKMQGEYGYGSLVIAVGEAADGKFVTRLAGTDAVGQINFDRADPLAGTDSKSVSEEAAATAFAILENRWKLTQAGGTLPTDVRYQEGLPPAGDLESREQPSRETEVPRNVAAMVEFSGLRDWQEIRARLMQVAGIQALDVDSLSARTASITFDFAGSLGRLQDELGQNGFLLDERDGTFVLRSR